MADETYDIQLEAEQINTALQQVHVASPTVVDSSDNMVRASAIRTALDSEETARSDADAALGDRVAVLESPSRLSYAHVVCEDNDEDEQDPIPLTLNGFANNVSVDTTTDRVTILSSGVYRISASSRATNTTTSDFTGFDVSVLKNGTRVFRALEYDNDTYITPRIELTGSNSVLMELLTGDYLTLTQSQFGQSGTRTNTYLDVQQLNIT